MKPYTPLLLLQVVVITNTWTWIMPWDTTSLNPLAAGVLLEILLMDLAAACFWRHSIAHSPDPDQSSDLDRPEAMLMAAET